MPVKEYKPEELTQQTGEPAPSVEEQPGIIARMKANFNSNTQGAQPGDGPVAAAFKNFGAGGGDVLRSIAHPIDTAKKMADDSFGPPQDTGVLGAIEALNMPGARQVIDLGKGLLHQPARTMGQIGTGAIVGELGGAGIRGAGKGYGMARETLGNFRPESSPDIVPPLQSASERLAKAVYPDATRIPQFADNAQSQVGNIRDFARESANPMKTQAEFEQAIKGAGDKRYGHFLEHILEPNMEEPVEIPGNYGGEKTITGGANVGQVQARIAHINNVLDPAYRAKYPDVVTSSLSKATPEALKAEHDALVPAFHEALSNATGIPVDQIANLRQDFGTLRGMGSTVQGARMSRLGRFAAGEEGGNSLPVSKEGVVTKMWDGMRGGKEAVADRNFQKAWQGMQEASPPPPRPIPQIDPGFLHAKNLEELSKVAPGDMDEDYQSNFGNQMRHQAGVNRELQPQGKPFVPPVQPSEPIPRRLLQPMPEMNANYGRVVDLRPTTTDLMPLPKGFGEQMRMAAKERSQMRKGN